MHIKEGQEFGNWIINYYVMRCFVQKYAKPWKKVSKMRPTLASPRPRDGNNLKRSAAKLHRNSRKISPVNAKNYEIISNNCCLYLKMRQLTVIKTFWTPWRKIWQMLSSKLDYWKKSRLKLPCTDQGWHGLARERKCLNIFLHWRNVITIIKPHSLSSYQMDPYAKSKGGSSKSKSVSTESSIPVTPSIRYNITNTSGIQIDDQQKELLESDIEECEIETAIFSMPLNKVCGCDGFSVEFYRTFYPEIKHVLWDMYDEVLKIGEFGLSSRKGILTLIPKGNKDSRYIKNLCPLTLLNTDYKVLAKVMALWLKWVLPLIIGEQQNGFMENHQIQNNLRTTIDIITHIYQSGKKAVIVTIDLEKCFNRLEHHSIISAFKYFNFGPKFCAWSSIFFNKLLLCTQNAGYIFSFFEKTRGCNQGCNYSPFCFIVCSKIMSHLIKNHPDIKGIKMAKTATENVISQFVDDTALFLTYTESCIAATLSTLEFFESNTGLKISYKKTCIYHIGSLKSTNAKIYTQKLIQWSDGDIPLLGMTIKNNANQDCSGYEELLNKIVPL